MSDEDVIRPGPMYVKGRRPEEMPLAILAELVMIADRTPNAAVRNAALMVIDCALNPRFIADRYGIGDEIPQEMASLDRLFGTLK